MGSILDDRVWALWFLLTALIIRVGFHQVEVTRCTPLNIINTDSSVAVWLLRLVRSLTKCKVAWLP